MDWEKWSIAEIAVIPMIVGLIQFVKRFFPQAPDNLWLGSAFFLGIAFQVVAFLIANPWPWTLGVWLSAVVLGISAGLAATGAYDRGHDGEQPGSFSINRMLSRG